MAPSRASHRAKRNTSGRYRAHSPSNRILEVVLDMHETMCSTAFRVIRQSEPRPTAATAQHCVYCSEASCVPAKGDRLGSVSAACPSVEGLSPLNVEAAQPTVSIRPQLAVAVMPAVNRGDG